MALTKTVVLLAVVAFVAGTVYKPKPFKRYQPAVVPGISSKARNESDFFFCSISFPLILFHMRSTVCGDQYITGTGGSFQSPNYPNDYDPSNSCGWFLTAENGGRIAVIVNDLKTESRKLRPLINIIYH